MPKPTNKKTRGKKAAFTMDAIAYKRQVQERLSRATRGMTAEQEREFYRKEVDRGPLGAWWRAITARKADRGGQKRRRSA